MDRVVVREAGFGPVAQILANAIVQLEQVGPKIITALDNKAEPYPAIFEMNRTMKEALANLHQIQEESSQTLEAPQQSVPLVDRFLSLASPIFARIHKEGLFSYNEGLQSSFASAISKSTASRGALSNLSPNVLEADKLAAYVEQLLAPTVNALRDAVNSMSA